MVDVSTNVTGTPTTEQLAAFKLFASVNAAATDALLTSILRRAMAEVQKWEDRTLLATSYVVVVTEREDPAAPVKLYGDNYTFTSVADGAGNPVDYQIAGRQLFPLGGASILSVAYTTSPTSSALADLLPKVYRYACALYDGEDAQTLNRILQEE